MVPLPADNDQPVELPDPEHLDQSAYETRMSMLPPRSRRVAELLAQGLEQKQIAGEMGIALNTVRNHLKASCRRLGLSSCSRHTLLAFMLWGRR